MDILNTGTSPQAVNPAISKIRRCFLEQPRFYLTPLECITSYKDALTGVALFSDVYIEELSDELNNAYGMYMALIGGLAS